MEKVYYEDLSRWALSRGYQMPRIALVICLLVSFSYFYLQAGFSYPPSIQGHMLKGESSILGGSVSLECARTYNLFGSARYSRAYDAIPCKSGLELLKRLTFLGNCNEFLCLLGLKALLHWNMILSGS